MAYEVLVLIVVVNVLVTVSLWRRMASKANRGPELNKKASAQLWHSDPISPKHEPPKVAGGEFAALAGKVDREFFADFRDFANVTNWWLADEFTASRFRLQDLPDGDLSLNVDFSSGPSLGRCFAIYYNQTRIGRLEIAPGGHEYNPASPEVYTSVKIDWARFFDFSELSEFLGQIAWHVTTGDPNNEDFKGARSNINSAFTRTLWDAYHMSEFDQAEDQHWGELTVSFHGRASCYVHRRDAPARARRS